MKKVRVGDTIRWRDTEEVYTIKDMRIGAGIISGELHLEWKGSSSGNLISTWCYGYEETNKFINKGELILISNFLPSQHLKKHKLI